MNPGGKNFEKVSRYVCKGITYDLDLVIDIASKQFPLKAVCCKLLRDSAVILK